MTFDTMARLFPSAAALAELKGTPFQQMTELLRARRQALVLLLTTFAGEDALRQRASETACVIAQSLSEGGLAYLQVVRAAGPEKACSVLYRYRPEDPESFCFLLRRQQKEDFSVHYIAGMLRLLTLSKLTKGSYLPTLKESLEPPQVEHTGDEILHNIIQAALGGKEKTVP